jgi:hypothetical protein
MKKDKKKAKAKAKKARRASVQAVARAREGVARAGQKLADRVAELDRLAGSIEDAAVDRFAAESVAELARDQVLRDLGDLQRALQATKDPALEPFRHLPEAVLRWIQSRFGLTPYLEAGKVLQVPSEKLEAFSVDGVRGDAPSGVLVRLRVLAPGFKRGGEVVIPPRAELID